MAIHDTTLSCPDCASECTPWTLTGRTHYIECKNPACRRHLITVEVTHWLTLTDEEIANFHAAHTSYAVAAARK